MKKYDPQYWSISGQSLPWLCRVYRLIFKTLFRHRCRSSSRRVLLIAHNYLMLLKVSQIVETVSHNKNITWFCTTVDSPAHSSKLISDIKEHGFSYINPYFASIQLWDLVVVADHSVTHHFNPSIPTLLVHHGLGDAKISKESGERYQYACKNVLKKNGQPVYTCMFESSERRKKEAENKLPVLKGHISVIGHIEADSLFQKTKHRVDIRKSLGFSDRDIVVFIGSSHGAESLMNTFGEEIIKEALLLPQHYKLILWAHNNLWQHNKQGNPGIAEILRKYQSDRVYLCKPQDDLLSCIAASDIGLTDFTSVSLYFAVLKRPIIFVPIPNGIVSEKCELWRLYCKAPKVYEVSDLQNIINEIPRSYPFDVLDIFSIELVSYPGKATSRIKTELYRLLKIV